MSSLPAGLVRTWRVFQPRSLQEAVRSVAYLLLAPATILIALFYYRAPNPEQAAWGLLIFFIITAVGGLVLGGVMLVASDFWQKAPNTVNIINGGVWAVTITWLLFFLLNAA